MCEGKQAERVFLVHCQCANCQRSSTKRVPVPMVEDAPTTVDEFIEATEHNPVPFTCRHCESLIGELVGVTLERSSEAA